MLNDQWKKRFFRLFKLRFAVLYPLGIWAVFSAVSTDESIIRGICFILLRRADILRGLFRKNGCQYEYFLKNQRNF